MSEVPLYPCILQTGCTPQRDHAPRAKPSRQKTALFYFCLSLSRPLPLSRHFFPSPSPSLYSGPSLPLLLLQQPFSHPPSLYLAPFLYLPLSLQRHHAPREQPKQKTALFYARLSLSLHPLRLPFLCKVTPAILHGFVFPDPLPCATVASRVARAAPPPADQTPPHRSRPNRTAPPRLPHPRPPCSAPTSSALFCAPEAVAGLWERG